MRLVRSIISTIPSAAVKGLNEINRADANKANIVGSNDRSPRLAIIKNQDDADLYSEVD